MGNYIDIVELICFKISHSGVNPLSNSFALSALDGFPPRIIPIASKRVFKTTPPLEPCVIRLSTVKKGASNFVFFE